MQVEEDSCQGPILTKICVDPLSPPEGQNFKRLGWGAESKIKILSMEINGNP